MLARSKAGGIEPGRQGDRGGNGGPALAKSRAGGGGPARVGLLRDGAGPVCRLPGIDTLGSRRAELRVAAVDSG